MRYFILFSVLIFIPMNVDAQIDYDGIRSKKLTPISIDTITESIIVVNKKNAILFFRQNDIKSYVNSLGKKSEHDYLKILLSSNTKKIIIKDWTDYEAAEREKMFGNMEKVSSDENFSNEFYYVGADLIHNGKFMIIDKKSNQIVEKKLRIKRIKGLYGTRYAEFLLPDDRSFWSIVTRLGL